ncbi:MAG: endopeptidase La [Candidatus Wallbacteria bacterium HGW-Wallbacteria-1]|jgi:ATP-dependent Lon protease|uniref:Lon protease n=1 Tax=Candidatus Wallbacteria bacterium HGW-Wallbacteria-1 TaxID=2013854 RepID=A0A2N1PLM4_9BACT|nr:MAG: endopeptidase La [Candidatus Wallbacteria bacterium HGW-Wallbacteria-1]
MTDRKDENHEGDNHNNGENSQIENHIDSGELILADDFLPMRLVLLPLFRKPVFPGQIIPLVVGGDSLMALFRAALDSPGRTMGLILTENDEPSEEQQTGNYKTEDFLTIGTAARIIKHEFLPNGSVQCVLAAIKRFKIETIELLKPYPVARVAYPGESTSESDQNIVKAYSASIMSTIRDIIQHNPVFSHEMNLFLTHSDISDPGRLADIASSMTNSQKMELQDVLETFDIGKRCEKVLLLLKKELDFSQLKEKINKQIEEKITKQQREFFLRQQLKAIKGELGLEMDEKTQDLENFRKKIENLDLPVGAAIRIQEELEKLSLLDTHSPEFGVSRNYVDWLTSLPWGRYSQDNLNLDKVEKILNQDHYGLEDVKTRIVEFMGVSALKGEIRGSIILFVGPPGVGKTSLGKSIARALGRKFYRFSLGGMRDEAEIKGHRRTYIGAMPGKFIQAMKIVNTANPVIMLDEIDKVGSSYHGDPASALLEVLDPEQNCTFLDHYLDVPFDLSKVLFIATANILDTIPPALLDRMEVMKLSGYILQEKVHIAKKFIIPKQLENHGLSTADVTINTDALKTMISTYARESGVRNLEKQISRIYRQVATSKARNPEKFHRLKIDGNLETYLGKPAFSGEEEFGKLEPGVVTGLAWTALGGARLYIESRAILGKEGFTQTGQLGDIMKESSIIAYSYVRSIAMTYSVKQGFFTENTLHLHVPAGATPKDGPSAGITMATSLLGLAMNKPVKSNLAMTGELTLTGRVLPVGGIKEKVLAARRGKIKILILPKDNIRDFEELQDFIRKGLTVHFVGRFEEVIKLAFPD